MRHLVLQILPEQAQAAEKHALASCLGGEGVLDVKAHVPLGMRRDVNDRARPVVEDGAFELAHRILPTPDEWTKLETHCPLVLSIG